MTRLREKKFVVGVVALLAAVVAVAPALLAFRYTAPQQRETFLRHPWRGWSFVLAAVTVPGDSALKTSGMALRKADWVYKGTVVDPVSVQLVLVDEGRPFRFSQRLGGREVAHEVAGSGRFLWLVEGDVRTLPADDGVVVAVFDYVSGRLLYDVRDDLTPAELVPATPSPGPTS